MKATRVARLMQEGQTFLQKRLVRARAVQFPIG
jgi:hypothetical protein